MLRKLLIAAIVSVVPALAVGNEPDAAERARMLVQLLDYIAVDYRDAVRDGVIISEAEYAEMREFARSARDTVSALNPPLDPEAGALADTLVAQVERKSPPEQVAATAQQLRNRVIAAAGIATAPPAAPDLARGQALYRQHCASCHGSAADGAGPAAPGLDPAPTDFTDRDRWAHRSLYGLYSTIRHGVEGTAMPSFAELGEQALWDLAFYVGSRAIAAEDAGRVEPGNPAPLLRSTPSEWHAAGGDPAQMIALRLEPAPWFTDAGDDAIARARALIGEALVAYEAGARQEAYRKALSAYLDGFELAENALATVDPALMRRAEQAMLALRAAIQRGEDVDTIRPQGREVLALLDEAARQLGGDGLGPAGAFTASLVILLREGLEAILVVAALLAFVRRTGRPEAARWLHFGWILALAAGGGLWWLSTHVIAIGGGTREQTEGIAALLAAAVMFYLGFWMHQHSQSQRWQQYVGERVHTLTSRGRLAGLAALSFVAVFRECFETVLFYQALWSQTRADAQPMIASGAAVAALALLVLAVLVLRLSARLPMRQFFAGTGLLLFVLAVVFAGKGMIALQEAGIVPLVPVPAPRIDWIGLYPNALSIGLQVAMIAVGIVLLRRRPAQPA